MTTRVRVWDGWVRLSHWLIVALVALCWWTGEKGPMQWHQLAGYGALAVVLFRIWWGFVGGQTARFSCFLRGPRAVAAYASGLFGRAHKVTLGHNPMGGWSVLLLIALLLAVTLLGLFAVDIDGIESGPLSWMVSFDMGRLAAEWHETLFDALLVVIAVHVLAVVFYLLVKRENLIGAMVGGYKRTAEPPSEALRFAPVWRALLGLAAAGAITWALASGLRWFFG
jgi:cytochrome b